MRIDYAEAGMQERAAKTKSGKKAVNVSIDCALADEAKAAGINLSALFESALRAELKVTREAEWKAENRGTIESMNRYIEKHGLPLAKYRVW